MGLFGHLTDGEPLYLDDFYRFSNSTILPIKKVTTREFRGEGAHPSNTNEIIEINSGQLAEKILQNNSGYAYDMVQYYIREIIRNIYEHSGATEFMYSARYFESSKIAEICISDNGTGIHFSLTNNKRFKHLTPRQSIQWACLPGVSGNPMASVNNNNPWRNSGFGLYMMNKLCSNNGDFLIISDNIALYMQSKKTCF